MFSFPAYTGSFLTPVCTFFKSSNTPSMANMYVSNVPSVGTIHPELYLGFSERFRRHLMKFWMLRQSTSFSDTSDFGDLLLPTKSLKSLPHKTAANSSGSHSVLLKLSVKRTVIVKASLKVPNLLVSLKDKSNWRYHYVGIKDKLWSEKCSWDRQHIRKLRNH